MLRPGAASLQELGHEGKETHPKSCSRHPDLSMELMQPSGLHLPHPTSCPGPAAGCDKVNRHQHPYLGRQPSTARQCPSPQQFGEHPRASHSPLLPALRPPDCFARPERRRTRAVPGKVRIAGRVVTLTPSPFSCPGASLALQREEVATTRGHPCPRGALRDRARHI